MSPKKHIHPEVEKTLQALDGLEPATTDAFFYSRLTAKLEHRSKATEKSSFEFGFAFAVAAVFLIISLNIISISTYSTSTAQDAITLSTEREVLVNELADEYQVAPLNIYESFEAE
jgi:hypothetical protein